MSNLDLISSQKPPRSRRYILLAVVSLSAGIPRILAAFLLPNEEGDPYAYVQAIEMMRASIVGGTFTPAELFGFWLPLYQFICALITVVVGEPLYVAKVVSAVCGTGVCLFVFEFSEQLTANRMLSLAAFALIALNPIHIMYSAFSMSDVPHAFLVMASLWFAIRNRWVLAAGMVAVGSLMRPESWLFIVLLPALQFILHRRVSIAASFVSLSAPLIWLYISWASTGNFFEYFKVRREYIAELLSKDPGLASFSPPHVFANLQTLLYSTGHAVLIACFVAAFLFIHFFREANRKAITNTAPALAIFLAYFFSSLGFLLFAYVSKNQPAIFARYCLGLFALGIPVLALVFSVARNRKSIPAYGFCGLLVALCLWQWTVQLRDGAAYLRLISQKRIVADYLRGHLTDPSNLRVLCDDDTIKVLAGIPPGSFVSSVGTPADSRSFLDYLKQNRVEYVVYDRRNGSAPEMIFRALGEERIGNLFKVVASTNSELRLYRTVF